VLYCFQDREKRTFSPIFDSLAARLDVLYIVNVIICTHPLCLPSTTIYLSDFIMSRKTNIRMTKIVLSISFIILFGRLIYSAIGAYSHHQNQKQPQAQTEMQTGAQAPEKTCTGTLKTCRYAKD